MGRPKVEVSDESATESDDSKTDTDLDDDNDIERSPPRPDSSPFAEGEKVLAFHESRVYEAKVRKVEFRKKWRFFVHYLGWNKNWDEWVDVDRLMKCSEENIQKQKEINVKLGSDKNRKAARVAQTRSRSSTVTRSKKRKTSSIVKETVASDKLINIQIPQSLKKQLVDDCEYITHKGKLVKLPRSPNVEDILNRYLDYRLEKDGMIGDSIREVLKGLGCYFDKALSVMLLYKNERRQYQEVIANEVSPSKIYGAEHLLRLFVKLPELLSHANIEEETLKELQQKLLDFLKFLQKNQSSFFLSAYYVPKASSKDDK